MEVLVGPGLEIVGPSSLMERRDDSDSGLDDSSDSSIGAPDDSEEEEEEEDEEEDEEDDDNGRVKKNGDASPEDSKLKLKKGLGSLGSLASLEDSLPSKRGLSLHMSGKSKSFTNLSEASIGSMKDLEKTEHPFNKKRRILRWSRRNYYRGHNPKSMPVLPLIEDDDDEEDDDEDEVQQVQRQQQQQQKKNHQLGQQSSDSRGAGFPGIKQHHRVFKSSSYSCFSLADLPEDEEDD